MSDPIIQIVAERGSDRIIEVEHAVSELCFKENIDGNCSIRGAARPISEKGLSDLCVAWLKLKRPEVVKDVKT
jgi:hypothetical protein